MYSGAMGVERFVKRAVFGSKPRLALATVNGRTHRLTWADRNAGWRMKCSCGWIDPKLRLGQRKAKNVGNAHVRSSRWSGKAGRAAPIVVPSAPMEDIAGPVIDSLPEWLRIDRQK